MTYLNIVSCGQALLSDTFEVVDTTGQEVFEQTVSSTSITRYKVLVA